VKRDEKELRPIDYFSESQKQILVLSLFFASAITQNWSSFSPIFMDDPVTHFDDLNAYAFLDLISGMLQSEGGQRQFIISTCEEKLFQLMRQKFFGYGDRVKIYEFVTIGESGPVYKKIVNGEATEPIH
jgi:exonuclease SbcC